MTKRVFEAMARRIQSINYNHKGTAWDDGYNIGLRTAVRAFCDTAKEDNPRFDEAKFLTACGFE